MRNFRAIIFLFMFGLIGNFLSWGDMVVEKSTGSASAPQAKPGAAPATPQTAYTKKDRLLEAGDKLRVKIYPEDEFIKSTDTEVSSEGTITLPLIGRVKVQGMKAVEAEREIAQILAKDYLVDPVVVVEIGESGEVQKKSLAILGQVSKPGTYDFPPDQKLSLLRVISMAGGFSDIANVRKIKVIRKENGKTRILRANAESIISGSSPDIDLEPGDVISVGESLF